MRENHTLILYADDPGDIADCAALMLKKSTESRIFVFNGEIGAGKTTLIKEICRQLGYSGEVVSPTFSIINVYPGQDKEMYHMDLYRLKDTEEALETGIEEYLDSGNYCFIEWPELVIHLLDNPYYSVTITIEDNLTRKIECETVLY